MALNKNLLILQCLLGRKVPKHLEPARAGFCCCGKPLSRPSTTDHSRLKWQVLPPSERSHIKLWEFKSNFKLSAMVNKALTCGRQSGLDSKMTNRTPIGTVTCWRVRPSDNLVFWRTRPRFLEESSAIWWIPSARVANLCSVRTKRDMRGAASPGRRIEWHTNHCSLPTGAMLICSNSEMINYSINKDNMDCDPTRVPCSFQILSIGSQDVILPFQKEICQLFNDGCSLGWLQLLESSSSFPCWATEKQFIE